MLKTNGEHRKVSLQATKDIHMLARQIKPVLSLILEQARIQFNNLLLPVENNARSRQVVGGAYDAWQVLSNGTVNNRQEEFCLQTAYLQFVRIFFLRACEDHGLIPHLIADANLASTIKNTYLSLLKKLYSAVCSDNHFGDQDFFDWFTPDTQSLLSLLHLLRCSD